MNFAAYIQQLPRGEKKIFASRLGVTASYLSRLISGDRAITAERALQIESASEGQVTRFDLRPDLNWHLPNHRSAKDLPSSHCLTTVNLRSANGKRKARKLAVDASSTEAL